MEQSRMDYFQILPLDVLKHILDLACTTNSSLKERKEWFRVNQSVKLSKVCRLFRKSIGLVAKPLSQPKRDLIHFCTLKRVRQKTCARCEWIFVLGDLRRPSTHLIFFFDFLWMCKGCVAFEIRMGDIWYARMIERSRSHGWKPCYPL